MGIMMIEGYKEQSSLSECQALTILTHLKHKNSTRSKNLLSSFIILFAKNQVLKFGEVHIYTRSENRKKSYCFKLVSYLDTLLLE